MVPNHQADVSPLLATHDLPTSPVRNHTGFDAFNRQKNYQRDISIPHHRVRWNYVVDLPFGQGKPILGSAGKLVNRVVGGWQLAGIPVMPIVGLMNGNQGYEAYRSKFSHASEVVKPGYHKVRLDNYGVTVELTSTKRAGFHRYSFPATEDAYVLLDAGAPLAMTTMQDASIRKVNGKQLAGYSVMAPTQRRPKPVTVYFVAQFDREMSEFGGWEKGVVRRGAERVSGARSGGYARFKFTRPGRLLMKVGISYVSEEQAAQNLAGELSGWDFDAVVRGSFEEWDQWLGKIDVQGGTDQQKQKFYTDLWHALLGRRTFSDLDGSYVDNTGDQPKVRKAPPTRSTYNSDAFWGSQWNLNILWSMAYPKLMSEMLGFGIKFTTLPKGPDDAQPAVGESAPSTGLGMTTSALVQEIGFGPAGLRDTEASQVHGCPTQGTGTG